MELMHEEELHNSPETYKDACEGFQPKASAGIGCFKCSNDDIDLYVRIAANPPSPSVDLRVQMPLKLYEGEVIL